MIMCCVPRPAPIVHSATAAAFASLSIATGSPQVLLGSLSQRDPLDRNVHREDRRAFALVDRRRDADADGGDAVVP